MKNCNKCQKLLNLDSFHKNKTKPDGLADYCKSCRKAYNNSPTVKATIAAYTELDKLNRKNKKQKYNKDHKDKNAEWNRAYWQKPKNKKRRTERMRFLRYGVTNEQFELLFSSQDGVCAICKFKTETRSPKKPSPHIDHCHKTGRIRGLLCNPCNKALGLLLENPQLALAAFNYLNNADTGIIVSGTMRTNLKHFEALESQISSEHESGQPLRLSCEEESDQHDQALANGTNEEFDQ